MPAARPILHRPISLGTAAGIAMAGAILALHAALLPEAHWQADDFICAAYARDGHLRYLWQARIGGWSPRPLSESVFYIYGRIAAAAGRPFIVPFLALLWAALIASTLVTMPRQAARTQTGGARVLIGLATACMFLLGHPVAEMFFWPAGAVAYVSTLAATSLALFLLADGRAGRPPGLLALSASIAAAAASSEAGAFAAVPLAVAVAVTTHRRQSPQLVLPALLMSGFVLWTLAHHRAISAESVHGATLPAHILASLRPVPRGLLDDLLPIWPARLLFALGLRWCWRPAARADAPPRALPAFAAALMLGAAATIAAAWFQFGTACCERHDSLRQGWVILALAAMAIWSAHRWPATPACVRLGPVMLLAACLLGAAPRLATVAADFRLMHRIVAGQQANWKSGRDRSTASMVFRLPPPAAIAGGIGIPPGRYTEPAAHAWTAHGIMHFFAKRGITVMAP